jgi:hypothetical protein
MIRHARPALAALGLLAAAPAAAETAFPATLAGHVFLPALTLAVPPADAPRDAWLSGKFTGPARAEVPMSVPGDTGTLHGRRPTGLGLPFIGQPVQGLSGFAMERAPDGSVYAIIDNGFGAKNNSADALLSFLRLAPEFPSGSLAIREQVFLRDPDGRVPFRIVHEGTAERYLTGGDFDPESIQLAGGAIWIGEEFGPYLIRVALDGRVEAVYPTLLEGREIRSPDHPALRVPAAAGKDFVVTRSGGFEGMAHQPGTGLLWAMLEKPILAGTGEPEGDFLRVLAFDPARGEWTGQEFRFRLADGATAIGDFNFVDATRALVIERDNGEGDPSLACADPAAPAPDCFPLPAKLKRITLVDTARLDAEGFATRLGHVDLMDIADPDGLARLPTVARRDLTGRFTMPFFTIEDVMVWDGTHILVGTDNNLPFSSGRQLDQAMVSELVLLAVPELLAAR